MKRFSALSAIAVGSSIYIAVRKSMEDLGIAVFDDQLSLVRELAVLPGSNAYILWGVGDRLLLSVDNRLVLFEGGEGRVVLEVRPGNFFWHAVEVYGRVFVQECGESPTGIYVSGGSRALS